MYSRAILIVMYAEALYMVAAQTQDELILLPATIIEGQQQEMCPAQADIEAVVRNISATVANIVQETANPSTCPCGRGLSGQWTRLAYLDMSDPTQQCPTNWNLISTPVRTCGRSSITPITCDSAIFPSGGRSYQNVCGRINAYQIGDPGAFAGSVRDGRNNIESQYITGLSLTHGAAGARQHIWSFAAYTTQASADDFSRSCDCASPSQNWPGQSYIDQFVGDDYFCDTGNMGGRANDVLFADDPLWDGAGCSGGSNCCEFNNPPWFCKTLPQPTTDNLEIRICNGQPTLTAENTAIEMINIYVQ